MPKATSKTIPAEEMEDMTLHGAINEEEAQLHVQRLNDIFDTMASKLNENDEEALGRAIQECKIGLSAVMPSLEEVEPKLIMDAILDPTCMAAHPIMEKNVQKLEEMIPPSEFPLGRDVASNIDELEPLTDKQREQIGELFGDMEVAHEHLACSCSALRSLIHIVKI